MRKFLKKLVLISLLAVIIIGGTFTYQGYNLYKEAINEVSIEDKVEEIKNATEDYVEFEELPKDYINAVIAVEDRRFFFFFWIDLIYISRAVLKDFQTFSLA